MRRQFTDEFRMATAGRVIVKRERLVDVCKELTLAESVLRRWMKEYRDRTGIQDPPATDSARFIPADLAVFPPAPTPQAPPSPAPQPQDDKREQELLRRIYTLTEERDALRQLVTFYLTRS